jgi:O-antigen/teichoic acid export membrane protein
MTESQTPNDNDQVARGAGFAFLGRLGALIEPIGVILFAKLYGAPTLGLFLLLWGYVQLVAVGSDFAMTTALQRFVPSTEDEDRIHGTLKLSLIVSTVLSILFAVGLSWGSDFFLPYISADPAAVGNMSTIIDIYVWAIPLWCFIDVSTAAVRARRVFGPEIKIRIFYEQGLRLVAGVAFFLIGFKIYGLFLAHLAALLLAGVISVRLLGRHYSYARMLRTPITMADFIEAMRFSTPMAASNLMKRLHINLPLFVLNLMLPGAAGATAVAVYAVARKVVSVLHVIRQSFEYVIAPIAAATQARADHHALHQMYAYSTRMMCCLFLPAAAGVVLVRHEIVGIIGPEFQAAAIMIVILAVGRAVETLTGPAAVLTEMLARYRLPLLNGLAGLAASAVLLFWLTPIMGPPAAAIATAVGVNVTAWASLVEIWYIYRQTPYDRHMIRPILVALAGAGLIALIEVFISPFGGLARFTGAVIGLIAAFILLLRYGFNDRDASTFGKLGRRLRP